MNRITKLIYELCRVLEKRELTLDFSCFYSFAEILESHHYCPGFYFEQVYYEIRYDDNNYLKVVNFGVKECKEIGDILTEEQMMDL